MPYQITGERLTSLFRPHSVALVGASDKSVFSQIAHHNLVEFGFADHTYLVSRRGTQTHGQPTVTSCVQIGEPVDVAYLMVPQAGLRVWGVDAAFVGAPFAQAVSDDVKLFADSLAQPYCGANNGFEAVRWLEDSVGLASLALVPLRRASVDKAFGLLVLASPDPTRYGADMATDFLARLGEVAGAALARLLPPHE